jgi:hypothetical protein
MFVVPLDRATNDRGGREVSVLMAVGRCDVVRGDVA